MINMYSCVSALLYVLTTDKLIHDSHILGLTFAINRKIACDNIAIPQKQYSDVPYWRLRFIIMIEACSIHSSQGNSIWFHSLLSFDPVDLYKEFLLFVSRNKSQFNLLILCRNKTYSPRGSHFGWTFPCDLASTLPLWWLTVINKCNILIPFGGVHKEGKGSKQKDVARSAKPISSAWDKVNATLFLKPHKTRSKDRHAK